MKSYGLFAVRVLGVILGSLTVIGLVVSAVLWQGNMVRMQYGTATALTGRVKQFNEFHNGVITTILGNLGSGAKAIGTLKDGTSWRLYGYNEYSYFETDSHAYGLCPRGQVAPIASAFIERKYVQGAPGIGILEPQIVAGLRAKGYTVAVKEINKDQAYRSYALRVKANGFETAINIDPVNLIYAQSFYNPSSSEEVCLPLNQLPAPTVSTVKTFM